MGVGTEVVELEVRPCVRLEGKDVLVVSVEDTGLGEGMGELWGSGEHTTTPCGPGLRNRLDSQSQGKQLDR